MKNNIFSGTFLFFVLFGTNFFAYGLRVAVTAEVFAMDETKHQGVSPTGVELKGCVTPEYDKHGYTEIHSIIASDMIVEAVKLKMLRELLSKKHNFNVLTKYEQHSPLYMAIKKSSHNLVTFLLTEAHVDLSAVNEGDEYGYALLHNVIHMRVFKKSDKEVQAQHVKTLLAAKADPNLVSGYEQHPPLYMAAEKGRFEVIKVLVAGKADINYQNLQVSDYNRFELCGELAKKELYSQSLCTAIYGKKLKDANIALHENPYNGRTALHAAVTIKNKEIIDFLKAHDARTDIKDSAGYTAKDIEKMKPGGGAQHKPLEKALIGLAAMKNFHNHQNEVV